MAGTVIKLGPEVSNIRIGDRVALGLPGKPFAIVGFREYPGLGIDGGYAEYIVAPTGILVKIPDKVSFAEAAFATDSIATTYHAVVLEGQVNAGTKVGIVGLGGLGLNGVRIATLRGATVYGFDIDEKKFAAATQ